MSRAPQSSFAQYFPSAPRATRDKAKERERSKLHISESSATDASSDNLGSFTKSKAAKAVSLASTNSDILSLESSQVADDIERAGDILNGVGSASSHTSTVSSVFSAPIQPNNMTTLGTLHNASSLTPLTNHGSSPLRLSSPKSNVTSLTSTHIDSDKFVLQSDTLGSQTASERPATAVRILARDPTKSIKGHICTYNPELDRTSGADGKYWAKLL